MSTIKTKTTQKYAWKSNIILHKEGRHKLNVQKIAEQIETVRKKQGGFVTPDDIVNIGMAKPNSPLGKCFRNPTEVDAYKWRLQIARSIMGNITTITVDQKGNEIIGMHLLSVPDKVQRAYTDVVTIGKDADLLERVVTEALRRLEAWQRRYDDIVELSHISKAIDDARGSNE